MTDPLRSDRLVPAGDVPERERDERVEQLLLSGLDHYFAGQYELAISVWTRVLFLNHGHARARAYIERARRAVSERQRESEELLHGGVEAFTRGDSTTARRLLNSAVERGAPSEAALALLDRLNRLEPSRRPSLYRTSPPEPDDALPVLAGDAVVSAKPSRTRWLAAGAGAGAVVLLAAGWLWFKGAEAWPFEAATPARTASTSDFEPLPVPPASEASIARARALQSRGRLHEALAALDAVGHGDSLFAEADRLRAVIQQQLLSGEGSPIASLPAQPDQGPRR